MSQVELRSDTSSLVPEIGRFPSDLLQNPLAYNRQFPFLEQTQGFVDSFYAAQRPEFQTAVMYSFGNQVIRNPFLVSRVFDNLRIITFLGNDPRAAGLLPRLFNHLRGTVPPREVMLGWSPVQMQYLFDASYDHFPQVSEITRAIKPKLLAAPAHPDELVDLHYKLAWGMANSWQTLARIELYEQIENQQSALSPNIRIRHDLGDPAGLLEHRYEQINDAMEVVGKLLTVQGRLRGRQRIIGALTDTEAVQIWIDSLHLDQSDPIGQVLTGKVIPEIRYALEHREHIYAGKAITTVPIELANGLNLSVFSDEDLTPEVRANTVREIFRVVLGHALISRMGTLSEDVADLHLNGLHSGIFPFLTEGNLSFVIQKTNPNEASYGGLATILEYHRPQLTDQERQKIPEKVTELKAYIKGNLIRDIRQDGYLVIPTSPHLRKLGYKHLVFTPLGEDSTLVKITLSGENHTVVLGPDFQIQSSPDLQGFVSEDDKLWLELLLISHLKRVHCYTVDQLRDQLPTELRKTQGNELKFRIIRRRNEHLKQLPAGKRRTTDRARKLFENSRLRQRKYPGKSLDDINQDREATFEKGLWTFVRAVERDDFTVTPGPIRLVIQDAAEEIQSVVHLGVLSQAEVMRISLELLDDLVVSSV